MASQLSIPLYLQVPAVAEYVHPATRPHAASEPALEHRQRFTACWHESGAVPEPPYPPVPVVPAVPPACPPEPEAAVLLLVQAASGVDDSRQATAKQCFMFMITPSAILPGVLASRAMICVLAPRFVPSSLRETGSPLPREPTVVHAPGPKYVGGEEVGIAS